MRYSRVLLQDNWEQNMASHEREVVLGAVVFVALAIVVVGSVWLSENYAGAAGGYKVTATFDSVQGLTPNAWVTLRGVKVGKVLDIDTREGRPVVTLGLEKIRGLPRDSKLIIRSSGMLGEKEIEVQAGSDSRVLADGEHLTGVLSPGLEELTARATDMAQDLNRAVDKLVTEDNLAHIQNTLVQMDSTTFRLKTILEENRATFSKAIDSLALASGEARGMLGENREQVRQAVEDLRTTTERLAAVSENMEAASTSLQEVLENLNEVSRKVRDGEGTLGRLVNDEQLYRELQSTLASVNSLLEDVKRDPARYFKFSIF